MLPLVQMQPCAMPRSPHTTSHASLRAPSNRVDHDHYARNHTHSSFPRAFPIRTSQSNRRAGLYSSSPYPPRSDQQLRRKNLGGVIQESYNDPSVLPNPGSSSREHLAHASNANQSTYQLHTPLFPPPPPLVQAPWTATSLPFAHGNQAQRGGVQWSTNNELMKFHGPAQPGFGGPQGLVPGSFRTQAPTPNIHQPALRANEYNVRAFCPPPMPVSEALTFGYGSWQPNALPWSHQNGGYPHYLGVDQLFYGNNRSHNDGSSVLGDGQTPFPLANKFVYDTVHHCPGSHVGASHAYEASTFASSHGSNPCAQQGFRQRAIAHAHQAYIDLINHLQLNRKPQDGRGSRLQGPSKPFVYPKPPNPIPIGGFDGGAPFSTSPFKDDPTQPIGTRPNFDHTPSFGGIDSRHARVLPGMVGGAGLYHPQPGAVRSPWNDVTQSEYLHFASRAQSSLEVLNTLCEQSGWRWCDGMLLGGCLHYGLENYDGAFLWFSRVIAVESR